MGALNTYITQCRRLLHDANGSLWPDAELTDYINEAKDFIALTDAEVRESEGRIVLSVPFLNLSRDHIVIVTPGH